MSAEIQTVQLIKCAFCTAEIESDSFYCDQCSREIMLCEECGKAGRDQWCEEDGGALVSAKSTSNTSPVAASEPVVTAPIVNAPSPGTTTHFDLSVPIDGNTSIPQLQLKNGSLGISLSIVPGSILGRTTGNYSAQLSQFNGISGRHLQFDYTPARGWTFRDLGSTNRTRYSAAAVSDWKAVPVVEYNTDIKLASPSYLAVANVVFEVNIK